MYSLKGFAYKQHKSQSPESLVSALETGFSSEKFTNYDSTKSLGKSRHLSAATKLWSSTANKLLSLESLSNCLENNPNKVGIFIAVENINLEDNFSFDLCAKAYSPDHVSPLQAPNTLTNVIGGHFARFIGAKGPNCTLSSGQSGGLQALDLAMLSIDNGAIEYGITGSVEISTDYHSKLDGEAREVAVACVIGNVSDNNVVLYPPLLRTLVQWSATDIAEQVRLAASKSCDRQQLDMVWLASGKDFIDTDQFHSALATESISQHLLLGEKLVGRGESCNALLFCGLAQELMSNKVKNEMTLLQSATLGKCSEKLSSVAIVTLDKSGQLAVLIMEQI